MSCQVYLDNANAETGKMSGDFAELAAQKGLAKHGNIVNGARGFALDHGEMPRQSLEYGSFGSR